MATTDLSNDVAKLRSDMDEIRRDLASIARNVKDLGTTKGQEAFTRAEERIGREINQRPLASVLTALGVGFVIGKLLHSGR
jgi:ElaB/YqjD/DUF883 family membrane-anchored ribosome-binding protein